jgi:adenylosuccinate synthase
MGIGPAYAARALRMSPRALDLFSKAFGLSHMLKFYGSVLGKRADLGAWLRRSRRLLRPYLGDVSSRIEAVNEKGGRVLFEGAHGSLLDLQFGTYPFVTSSSTIASGAASGTGIPSGAGGRVIGVTKAYTTRVGAGPFPSELHGRLADTIREAGREYGTTTGRPRRTGWLDLVALTYAVKLNGATQLALSKIDVLSKVKETKVCVAYSEGGSESTDFYKFLGGFNRVRPVYQELPSLYGASFADGIPRPAAKLIEFVEKETRAQVKLLSYGDERSRTFEL